MKKQQIIVDFDKAPRGKFIIVGHKGFNRTLLHRGANNIRYAERYAGKVARGEVKFSSLIAENVKELDGIEVIDDSGVARYIFGSPFGSFLMGGS